MVKIRITFIRIYIILHVITLILYVSYSDSPRMSLFEYNHSSNTVSIEWVSGTNELYELVSSTNLMTNLWGQIAGGTNFLGTLETNKVRISCGDCAGQFFRLITRSNSLQSSTISGIAFRANTNLIFDGYSGVSPDDFNSGSAFCIWDQSGQSYYCTGNSSRSGWTPALTISNNQFFVLFSPQDLPSEWSHAYIKDWRLTSPGTLPVTGDVLIEWTALESQSTPSNPVPEIPIVSVNVINSDGVTVTNWLLEIPDNSSVTWGSHSNPDGYYTIKVDFTGLETIEKQVYLYN